MLALLSFVGNAPLRVILTREAGSCAACGGGICFLSSRFIEDVSRAK